MRKNGYSVGWVVDARWPYINVMASTRIRCLDVIKYLRSQGIKSEIYKPFRRYDFVIFQKSFSGKQYEIARELSGKVKRIILDVNVNYFLKEGETTQVTQKLIDDFHRFLGLTDTVFVSSHYLKRVAEGYHPDVYYIPEHISTIGVYPSKRLSNPIKLLYCGYAIKASSVLLIEDVLSELSREFDLEVVFVCEKNPHIRLPVKSTFIKYRHKDIVNILREGDIKIAPRMLDNSYDKGHSFTKIGYPMSVGLPVIAGPVPSYKESLALLAETREEWLQSLKFLICNPAEYERLSLEGMAFVKENYSLQKIGCRYMEIFEKLFYE